jgi:hypothetical protein
MLRPMSAPANSPEPAQPTRLRLLLMQNLSAAALVFSLLEIWRPLYFLTDDNFLGGFPLLTGMGLRLARGESPFIADDIYGGQYDLLRDATSFCWHPIYLLASLMVSAAGFVCLADFLRRELHLPLSDARLMFLALSFNYSMIVLAMGSSWIYFLGNHSALPWLALGILQTSWRRGFGLVALFSVHGLLGGHLAGTVGNSLFLSLFAVGVAFSRRSLLPLVTWVSGSALAFLLISPLLVPACAGFLHAARAEGLSVTTMSRYAMPASLFPFSYLLGTFSAVFPIRLELWSGTQPVYSCAFMSCAAAWAIFPAFLGRAPWRRLEIISLGVIAVISLLVIRPHWVSALMIHLPILKSLQWPFREILQLQFFLHLFLVLRPPGGSLFFRRLITFAGAFLFVFPLFFLPAPTFNPMKLDRDLLFSGRSTRYWNQVKLQLSPDARIVPVFDPHLYLQHPFDVPFSLMGACNLPILFQVESAAGYSATAPRDQLYLQVPPATSLGIYTPEQEAAILEERPEVKFITLEGLHPLRITLSSRGGPTIDLTPDLPAK